MGGNEDWITPRQAEPYLKGKWSSSSSSSSKDDEPPRNSTAYFQKVISEELCPTDKDSGQTYDFNHMSLKWLNIAIDRDEDILPKYQKATNQISERLIAMKLRKKRLEFSQIRSSLKQTKVVENQSSDQDKGALQNIFKVPSKRFNEDQNKPNDN